MTHSPLAILNDPGGEILIDIIQKHGGCKAFPKYKNLPVLAALERLADDGYLETLQETPETVTYRLMAG